MTRILHITDDFFPINGGLSNFCFHLSRGQLQRGDTVAVLTSYPESPVPPPPGWSEASIRRVRFKRAIADNNSTWLRQSVTEAIGFKRTFQPEIIHVHAGGLFAWLHLLSAEAWPAAKVVLTLHSPTYEFPLPAQLVPRLLEEADRIVAVSRFTLQEWRTAYPEIALVSETVVNGLPQLGREISPALPLTSPTLLCLGRLHHTKGFDVALAAFARIAPGSPARLVVAGDGPARADLERQAAALGLGDRVAFRGWVRAEEVSTLIDEATLVLMPSLWPEPFGLVAIETALRGRPIVASRVGGLPEIVVDGETGRLVAPGEPNALAEAIESLFRQPAELVRMGAAAREHVQRHFGLETCVEHYERVYHRARSTPAT